MSILLSRRPRAGDQVRKDIRVLARLTQIYRCKKHGVQEASPLVLKGSLAAYARKLGVALCSEYRPQVSPEFPKKYEDCCQAFLA
jgi:hypothetical protein